MNFTLPVASLVAVATSAPDSSYNLNVNSFAFRSRPFNFLEKSNSTFIGGTTWLLKVVSSVPVASPPVEVISVLAVNRPESSSFVTVTLTATVISS